MEVIYVKTNHLGNILPSKQYPIKGNIVFYDLNGEFICSDVAIILKNKKYILCKNDNLIYNHVYRYAFEFKNSRNCEFYSDIIHIDGLVAGSKSKRLYKCKNFIKYYPIIDYANIICKHSKETPVIAIISTWNKYRDEIIGGDI